MGPQRPDWTYPNIEDASPDFLHSPGFGSHPPTSPVVTLHDLSHHVPAAAAKAYDRAVKETEKGKDNDAIPYFNKAIATDPEYCSALNDLGAAYFRLGKWDPAVEQFTKAIAVDPHAAMPRMNLATAYIRQGLFADAERTARYAITLDRVGSYGRVLLGAALVLQGRFTEEAERSLSNASGEYVVAKLFLAVGQIGRGDVARAADLLRTYISQAHITGSNFATRLLRQLDSSGQGSSNPGK
jgi:Flp pilus assembly protein TadD